MNSGYSIFPNENSAFIQHAVDAHSHSQNDELPLESTVIEHVDPNQSLLTFTERFKLLRSATKEDWQTGGPLQKLGILATAAWLAYEWGPGNETVTPIIAGVVIDKVSGPAGIATTAAIAGGFTFVQQVASGATVAATSTKFPELANTTFSNFFVDKDNPELNAKPWASLPLGKRLLYGFTMGTTFVATREAAVTGEVSFAKTIPRVVGSAALTSLMVGAIAGTVEVVDTYSSEMPDRLEAVANFGVDLAKNPLTWLSILGISIFRDHLKNKRLKNQLSQQTVQ